MTNIVQTRSMSKSYGSFKVLDDVDLDIATGSITGLIGPNGAGKTTTLKALIGLCDAEGELSVVGQDPRHARHKLMKDVCFIADVGILPKWLKVSQALDYVDAVHPHFSRDKAETFLSTTEVQKRSRIKALSKGMVTQLHLAIVMAIDVQLLVLDEPTLGLDIVYRKEFYDRLLNDYYDGNRTIIISTHQVEEIEALLTHLVFIKKGKIVLNASMEQVSDVFSEVLVNVDKIELADSYAPIYVRSHLGKKSYLFEGVQKQALQALGELHTPSVSDLFVAKMKEGIAHE